MGLTIEKSPIYKELRNSRLWGKIEKDSDLSSRIETHILPMSQEDYENSNIIDAANEVLIKAIQEVQKETISMGISLQSDAHKEEKTKLRKTKKRYCYGGIIPLAILNVLSLATCITIWSLYLDCLE